MGFVVCVNEGLGVKGFQHVVVGAVTVASLLSLRGCLKRAAVYIISELAFWKLCGDKIPDPPKWISLRR